jgi:hypothetical protein
MSILLFFFSEKCEKTESRIFKYQWNLALLFSNSPVFSQFFFRLEIYVPQ